MTNDPWSVSPGEPPVSVSGQAWGRGRPGHCRGQDTPRARPQFWVKTPGLRLGITGTKTPVKKRKVIIIGVKCEKRKFQSLCWGSNVTCAGWIEINLVRVNPIKVLWLNITLHLKLIATFEFKSRPLSKWVNWMSRIKLIGGIFTCNIFIKGSGNKFSLYNQSWCLFVQRRPGGARWLLKQTKTIAICR